MRKNAALAVLNIFHNVSPDLLPDAPELMDKFIRVRARLGGVWTVCLCALTSSWTSSSGCVP